MDLNIIDNVYDWDDISLLDYLNENNVPSNWNDFFYKTEIQNILKDISDHLSNVKKTIYPDINHVFRAFYETPLNNINTIIIGQDCYHNGNATGLCFDVKPGGSINPSLRNIYKELELEGYTPEKNGRLNHLTKQGVLLLNGSLTVEESDADSHTEYWYPFTEILIKYISYNTENVSWLLMGKRAQEFNKFIDKNKHNIVETSHPSPFSALRGYGNIPAFIGSNCFQKLNKDLKF
tara:strand:+ start:8570 stop:9274 length:705 start_codon:yes stop_codon:yes gene_type:complete